MGNRPRIEAVEDTPPNRAPNRTLALSATVGLNKMRRGAPSWAMAALMMLGHHHAEAKGSSGAGMGGMYWAFAVLILLVIGIIGYIIYQYFKAEMLQARMERDIVEGKQDAVMSYEEGRLAEFNSHFKRDLEL